MLSRSSVLVNHIKSPSLKINFRLENVEQPLKSLAHNMNPLFFDPSPIPHDQADDLRRFHPLSQTAKPKDLYHVANNRCTIPALRYIRKTYPNEMLIYIGGACSKDGTPDARAGYGIKYGPEHKLFNRLEGIGPETSNRAELRAATVALGLRVWAGEGFDQVILACDSEYLVKSVSEYARDWKSNVWHKTDQMPVQNWDLWKKLLAALEEQDDQGVLVQFWLIKREDNEAEPYAEAGTSKEKSEHAGAFTVVEL